MARGAAGIGFSVAGMAALVGMIVLVLRKGPVAALTIVLGLVVIIGVLTGLGALFGGRK